jgi:subtilisin family serine protease
MLRTTAVCLALVAACAVLAPAPSAAVVIDEGLRAAFLDKGGDTLPILLVYDVPWTLDEDEMDALRRMPPGRKRAMLAAELRKKLKKIGATAMTVLEPGEGRGRVRNVKPLYLAGAISFEADWATVLELARLPDAAVLLHDRDYDLHRAGPPAAAPAGDSAAKTAAADTAWSLGYIGAPRVWSELGLTGEGVVVGHIDTGARLDHSDLAGRLWVNPGEIAGNGKDDDGNGFIDDIHGWDFGDNDAAPDDDSPTGGHGTHTAGTVAGDGSGGTLTGVAPGARLMVCKVWRASGAGGSLGMIWAAQQYGVENGARILTMSLGFPGDIPDIYLRADRYNCANIRDAGVAFFSSAGNDHFAYDPPLELALSARVPAPWSAQGVPHSSTGGVITVGATGYGSDVVYSYGSQGPADWGQVDPWRDWDMAAGAGLIKPDIVLPGVNVNSTVREGGYSGDTWNGTSMACPHAAGVAALMLQKNPSLSPAGIDSLLELSAIDLGAPGKDNVFGAGRVDAYAAVAATPTALLPDLVALEILPDPDGDAVLDQGRTSALAVRLVNVSPVVAAADVTAELAVAPDPWVTVTDASGGYPVLEAGGGRGANLDDPFVLQVAAGAPHGHEFTLLLTVQTDTGFVRTFDIPWYVGFPEWRTHDLGGVFLTVTDQGILGYLNQDGEEGDGFGYGADASQLFVGSFWAGTGTDYVCARDYDGQGNERFEWVSRQGEPTGRVAALDGTRAAQAFRAVFSDAGHDDPRGLEVQQTSYAFPSPSGEGFVILEYGLTNTGDRDLDGLHAGVYCDFDISTGANYAGTDAARNLSYIYAPEGPYCGIVLLGDEAAVNLTAVNNLAYVYPTSAVGDAVKMDLLTGVISEDSGANPSDWSTLVSTVADLPAGGGRAVVNFAMVYGASLTALQDAADAARAAFAGGPLDDDLPLRVVHLDQNHPNPFNPVTTIEYVARQAGPLRIAVFDIGGRRVRSLVSGHHEPGNYSVHWDGLNDAGQPAPSGVYLYRLDGAAGGETRKMMLVR